jgi:predicted enzyme related to lactoylglutathione lyase
MATVSSDLSAARQFYTSLYPYEVNEGVFGGIRFLSILKDQATIAVMFERSAQNPIQGSVPILKVDSVAEYCAVVERLGGRVQIPQSLCPCTETNFALCADREGNQFILKEPVR